MSGAPLVGQPVSRVDGRLKVTGQARYAAEFEPGPDLAHAAIVDATIPRGRLARIDASEAESAPGVLAVITHRNAPRLAYREHKGFIDPTVGERLHVFQDDQVRFNGQPIGVVVAETLEQAAHAATLLRVAYAEEPGAETVFEAAFEKASPPGRKRRTPARRSPPEPPAATPTRPSPPPRCGSTPGTGSLARTTTRSSFTPPSPPGRATA